MDKGKAVKQWQKLSDETMEGMGEWREQNPKATLREIEKVLDERMMKLKQDKIINASVAWKLFICICQN
jgi:hypothetical protein